MKLAVSHVGASMHDLGRLAQHAEQLGFEAIFVPDHLVAPLTFDPVYPYRESGMPSFGPETPFADAFVLLGNLAALTKTIRLGVGVYVLPLRNPFVAAKAAATAQELSRGRVVLGVGIGWMREEFEAVGEEFKGRADRTEEMLDVMRKLWSGEAVEHEGQWYKFPALQMSPGISSTPPVLWGGSSPAAIKRAARAADGWFGPPTGFAENLAAREAIRAALAAEGRVETSFDYWPNANEPASAELFTRYRDAGFVHLGVRTMADASLDARLSWMDLVARWAG